MASLPNAMIVHIPFHQPHIPSLHVASQPASKQKQKVIGQNKAEDRKYSFISRGEEKMALV
jgi:hypothetical protein